MCNARFEVISAVFSKIQVFWDVITDTSVVASLSCDDIIIHAALSIVSNKNCFSHHNPSVAPGTVVEMCFSRRQVCLIVNVLMLGLE
jgi:hypothetical protein